MSSYTQKNVVGAFWAGFSCYISLWCFSLGSDTPEGGSWVPLPSPHWVPWCWAGCCCWSPWAELFPGCEHRQLPWTLPGNSGVKREIKPNADLNFIFPPTKLVQQLGKSLQIIWTSLGRKNNLLGCKIKQFCHAFFPLSSSLGYVYAASACERIVHGVRLLCGLGFMCPFVPIYSPVLGNWGLLDLVEMCLGSCLSWQTWAVGFVIYLQISWGDTTSLLSKDPSK